MRHGAGSIVTGFVGLCISGLAWGVVAAGPAAARGSASLGLSPSHGSGQAVFTANFHFSTGGGGMCPGGQVDFTFDSQPVASAALDPFSCTASAAIQVPLGAQPGPHKVHGTLTGGGQAASAGATFTVDQGVTTPPTSTQPSTSQTQPSTTSASATSSAPPSWSNSTTPVTPWTAPAFNPQLLPTVSGPCDTAGPHAPAPDKAFMVIPSYAAGAHPAYTGSTVISEPATGALPITSVGPAGMIPPQLGDGRHPYQALEVLQPIDPNVSPKLRLAAAAGEPFGCIQVESYGVPGSGYGYLVYALKGALVVSVQDVNADGSPFVVPTPTAAAVTPSPATPSKGGKATPTPTPTPAPKAKFERVVLGYTSLAWEYQEPGGQQAPVHRGAGTIVPPAPPAPLSYSNLVFAFGGLVAATVALMFAYHSRRRDLARRLRRQRATHA